MPDHILSRSLRVDQPRAAAAFADPLRRRIMLGLVARERSTADLASELGVELKRLHYHLGSLEKLGLIRIVGRRARGGRPIKLYRATAEAFFVPVGAQTRSPRDALAAELRETCAKLSARSREGALYHLEDNGRPSMRAIGGGHAEPEPYADHWRVVRLSRTEALRLMTELRACVRAAVERSEGVTATYLLHLGMAPRLER